MALVKYPLLLYHLQAGFTPLQYFTHIYPLQITIRLWRWNNSIISVNYRDNIHS